MQFINGKTVNKKNFVHGDDGGNDQWCSSMKKWWKTELLLNYVESKENKKLVFVQLFIVQSAFNL